VDGDIILNQSDRKMKIERTLITPDIAKQYLEGNKANRRTRPAVISRYAQEMKAGNWKEETAELIKIADSGLVLDGQHRLFAVIESGKSIAFYVATGVPEEVFDVLDSGVLRSSSDVLHVAGVKYANNMPSIISLFRDVNAYVSGTASHLKLTGREALQEYNEDPDFWDHVASKSIYFYEQFSKLLSPAIIGGLYAVFLKKAGEAEACKFMQQFCSGMDLTNNTIALMRNRLILDKVSNSKIDRKLKVALIIKTWNAYRSGKQKGVLKFVSETELFPVPL